jgi:hypothetical protein
MALADREVQMLRAERGDADCRVGPH